MIRTSIEIQGLEELEQKLLALQNDALAKKQVQEALMKAAQPMVKSMKARAPRAEAAYFRYYKVKKREPKVSKTPKKPRKENKNRKVVNPGKLLVQPGTLQRSVARKRVKLARSVGVAIYIKGAGFYWRFIEYGTPRMAAKPFIRNSFDNESENSLGIFKQKLRENIQKIIDKQRVDQTTIQDNE